MGPRTRDSEAQRLRRASTRSTRGPQNSTIIAVIRAPTSADTKVRAPSTAPAPIVANNTPNQCTMSPRKPVQAGSLADGALGRNSLATDIPEPTSVCLRGASMRFVRCFTALMILATPVGAQAKKGTKPADPDKPVTGGGHLPAGWSARTDEKGKEPETKFVVMDKGYHVTLGPAAIFWRASDKVEGPFRTVLLITQTKRSEHPEGYGIFVGGQGLTGDDEKYTYFLIRQDGKYLIKRRIGGATTNITSTWTAHPAIVRPNAVGEMTNRLEVTIGKDRLAFAINGKEVYTADPRLVDGTGIVGLRLNHNLDLHIDDFAVTKQK